MVNTQQYASYIPNAMHDTSWMDIYKDGNANSKFDDTRSTAKVDAHTKKEGAEVGPIGEGTWSLVCFVC